MYTSNQGCGVGTQISDSGSGRLNFLAPVPTSESFWLWVQNDLTLVQQFIMILMSLFIFFKQ